MTFNFLPWGGTVNALIAPAGTRIPMQQASAPFGWTSDTSGAFTDCSMRINSGSGGGTGGSLGWSGWNFGGTFNVNSFNLSISQMPTHNHGDAGHNHGAYDTGHSHGPGSPGGQFVLGGAPTSNGGFTLQGAGSGYYYNSSSTSYTATGYANVGTDTGYANIQNTGGGTGINPTYTTPQVKYADHIIGVKT